VAFVPEFSVSRAADVRPIFEWSCVRCHGAGGTLNADPRAIEDAPPKSNFDQMTTAASE
jgi:hypothetical protein